MDDERMPKNIRNYIFFTILALIIQSYLFLYFNKMGIIILLGLVMFMFIFSNKNKRNKKQFENNLLKKNEEWFKSKYKLTKEIP